MSIGVLLTVVLIATVTAIDTSLPLIVQHSNIYGQPSNPEHSGVAGGDICGCHFAGARADLAPQAKAIMFDATKQHPVSWQRAPDQVWIGNYWEPLGMYPFRQPNSGPYNLTMGYRPDSDFTSYAMVSHTAHDLANYMTYPIPTFTDKSTTAMMSAWISHCSSARLYLLRDLEAHGVTIASYGRCHHNTDVGHAAPLNSTAEWLRELMRSLHSGPQKMGWSSQHRFLFAAENSHCAYYHTEKLFHALMVGVIPVYFGADTIADYVPEHSIIKVSDFPSPQALAEHLIAVGRNETLYQSYLAWRTQPLPQHMHRLLNHTADWSYEWKCEFCHKVLALSDHTSSTPTC